MSIKGKGFAAETEVRVEKSQQELEALLERAGATQYCRFNGADSWVVQFFMANRLVRIHLPRPSEAEISRYTAQRHLRSEIVRAAEQEQRCRQRWRQLVLVVKAKLEAIAVGITTAEREFLADILLSDGTPIGQAVALQLAKAYESGRPVPLLGASAGGGPHGP